MTAAESAQEWVDALTDDFFDPTVLAVLRKKRERSPSSEEEEDDEDKDSNQGGASSSSSRSKAQVKKVSPEQM